jgi:hypothetical protein
MSDRIVREYRQTCSHECTSVPWELTILSSHSGSPPVDAVGSPHRQK